MYGSVCVQTTYSILCKISYAPELIVILTHIYTKSCKLYVHVQSMLPLIFSINLNELNAIIKFQINFYAVLFDVFSFTWQWRLIKNWYEVIVFLKWWRCKKMRFFSFTKNMYVSLITCSGWLSQQITIFVRFGRGIAFLRMCTIVFRTVLVRRDRNCIYIHKLVHYIPMYSTKTNAYTTSSKSTTTSVCFDCDSRPGIHFEWRKKKQIVFFSGKILCKVKIFRCNA